MTKRLVSDETRDKGNVKAKKTMAEKQREEHPDDLETTHSKTSDVEHGPGVGPSIDDDASWGQ